MPWDSPYSHLVCKLKEDGWRFRCPEEGCTAWVVSMDQSACLIAAESHMTMHVVQELKAWMRREGIE